MITRSERQDQCVQNWVNNKLKGTILASVAFGKTRVGLLAMKRFLAKNPTNKVIVIVPSDPIKLQWEAEILDWQLFDNCKVITMTNASKNIYKCDLLIVDEVQKTVAPSIIKLYTNIKYKALLCLTGTLTRLDGKDSFITNLAPVVDTITTEEAINNGWLSNYREYLVLIEPDDINNYNIINTEFLKHFAFFNNDFQLAMKAATDWKIRNNIANEICTNPNDRKNINKLVLAHAMGFSRTLQARKKYINNHPRKIELTNLILENRIDKKCITFSATVAMAEKIKYGVVYSGKDSVKKGRITLEQYKNNDYGIINSIAKLNEGFNDPSISVGIVLGINSSQIVSKQRTGRIIRHKEGKISEMFNLIIKDTVEMNWFQNCHPDNNYITISEDNLINILKGEPVIPKVNKKSTSLNFKFRF